MSALKNQGKGTPFGLFDDGLIRVTPADKGRQLRSKASGVVWAVLNVEEGAILVEDTEQHHAYLSPYLPEDHWEWVNESPKADAESSAAPGAWVREAERLGRELARTILHGLGDAAVRIENPTTGMGGTFNLIALRSDDQWPGRASCPAVVSMLAGHAERAFIEEWEKVVHVAR